MLGSQLVERLLAEGHSVRGVDLREPPTQRPRPEWTVGDVRDPAVADAALAGAGALVHCASALPSYPSEQIRSIIVDGTRNVLGAAVRAGVPRLVHVSSTAVYGLPKVVPTTEEYPREPVDAYSAAKAAAEEVAERIRGEGHCVTILRPKTFLGPGRMGLFAMLFEWAEEGRHFPVLGRGDVRVQMLGLDDLVDAVVAALNASDDVANDTYNLAAASFGTWREDFQAVLNAAGHGRRVIGLPARPALALLAVLQRFKMSPVYGRLLYKLMADSYVSIDKARNRLGFDPKQSNQDAILRTYEWWRQERATSAATAAETGRTSREPWRQGALAAAKIFF
jgi:nucleoside-diphosphate-sugar epimerase